MKVRSLALPEVLLLEPKVFTDARGWFFESFNRRTLAAATGIDQEFVQDNHSCSGRNVLRGLHYQIRQAQGKLVRVLTGRVFDVCVDLRRSSPRFGRWVSMEMSAEHRCVLWIPPGFAHGVLTLSDSAEVLYKTTDFFAPEHERCLFWKDPDVGIEWPLDIEPEVSEKDARGETLRAAEVFP
jgi:dTDP-4-dehydrorhamnose 3,5-epimerase